MTVDVREIAIGGMTFRCRTCGPADGEPVILLHGFPETSAMWTPAMVKLAEAGYRCLAPDQRGYSPGARPRPVRAYALDSLASDVVALAQAQGAERFHLVGHDWGAGCGWTVAELYPGRLLSWTSLSVPHMAAFGRAIRTDPDQRRRSRYMAFFQLPVLPELVLGAGMLERIWRGAGEEAADYRALLRPYEARRAILNWYRAARRRRVAHGEIQVPTLFIWGRRDFAVGRAGVEDTARHVKGDYTFLELDAGHWLPRQALDEVLAALLAHLKRNGARGGRWA